MKDMMTLLSLNFVKSTSLGVLDTSLGEDGRVTITNHENTIFSRLMKDSAGNLVAVIIKQSVDGLTHFGLRKMEQRW